MTRSGGGLGGYGTVRWGLALGVLVLLVGVPVSAGPVRERRAATGFSRSVHIPGTGFKSKPRNQSPCSHLGDAVNSVAARAYMAGTVFEGKVRSGNRAPQPGGVYSVTFVVQKMIKDNSSVQLSLRSQVRLRFRDKKGPEPGASALCQQSYNFTRRDPVRANIKQGRKYIVFVTGLGPHNFTVIGEPVIRTEKNIKAVRDVLCRNCFRPASVTGLQNTTVKTEERLKLVCRCKGNPLPAISWYKNGRRVSVSQNLKIQFKKKRSLLVIPKVLMEDGGRYECRGTTVTGERVSSSATVTVLPLSPPPATDNTTTLWPLYGVTCPLENYCLNGGTCTLYETVGELVCQCAEGYKGLRCENKDVYNRSSMYRPMSYFCKLGISSSYYC